ncbi:MULTISPECIES: SCO family protein [Acidiphilium]|uniref:Protein SCO1/2 n=1 Tax=Acidiphilium rubrum TaxID=526 RepID=A0A8G2FH06_ACIRU|nr:MULTISPECIES: SCO family protein [Acidiphilium]SIR18299.1 protein SCO1/2 [Acidiphilium rubrum]
MKRRPGRWWLAAPILALMLGAVIAPVAAWADPVVPVTGLVPPLAFTMTDASTGKSVTAAAFRGKTILLYFGYTNCPDVCPDTLYKVHQLYLKLGAAAANTVFLFVTVDPARDTTPVLRRYLALFDPHFVGLRGSANQIYRLTRRYRVVASVHPSPNPQAYQVVHSALIYGFGPHGNARFIIPDLGSNQHPDYPALITDIESLQSKTQPRGLLTWLARLG